jgi:hypothetical protein
MISSHKDKRKQVVHSAAGKPNEKAKNWDVGRNGEKGTDLEEESRWVEREPEPLR